MSFHGAFLAATNIIFAYSFSVCQYALMAEMHTPPDYMKSIYLLGLIEIVLYSTVGATVYAFVGEEVKPLSLLSTGHKYCRAAFIAALPVIFISGSINTTVAAKYLMKRIDGYRKHRNKSPIGPKLTWVIWVGLIAAISIFAWVIAEAVPFFSSLLGIISSLFISGFSFYFPALFWPLVLKKNGEWYKSWRNKCISIICAVIFLIGIVILVVGTYSSVVQILADYESGEVKEPFTCNHTAYI